MRSLKIVACVFALVAAFATHVNSKPVLQTAYGKNNANTCVTGTTVGSDCASGLATQCKVSISGVSGSRDAWQDASCTIAFTRNP